MFLRKRIPACLALLPSLALVTKPAVYGQETETPQHGFVEIGFRALGAIRRLVTVR